MMTKKLFDLSGRNIVKSSALLMLSVVMALDGVSPLAKTEARKQKQPEDPKSIPDKVQIFSPAAAAVPGAKSAKKPLPPAYLALKKHQYVADGIETALENKSVTKPSIVGIYRKPDGSQSTQALHNDAQTRRSFASVGKMLTLAMVDDVLKEGKITLDQKLLPSYQAEFDLPKDTTIRDAIKATYTYSNNYAAQALLKTAIHKDLGLPDHVALTETDTADYILGYMRKQGFVDSVQFNGPGYPEKSDWASEDFSPDGVPSRATGHSPAELVRFFGRKYCLNGDQPISKTMRSLLNLKNWQSPTSVTMNHYGLETRQVRPHGLQAVAKDYFADNKSVVAVIAKSGTDNRAQAGMVVVSFKNGTCKIVAGGGLVPNRNSTIPGAIYKIDTKKPTVPQAKPKPKPAPKIQKAKPVEQTLPPAGVLATAFTMLKPR